MMEGMIRACDPPDLFEYDWVSEAETTVVRYELEVVAGGTRLTLTEKLLGDRNGERRGAGWQHHVERLIPAPPVSRPAARRPPRRA